MTPHVVQKKQMHVVQKKQMHVVQKKQMRTYTPQLKLLVFVLNFLYQKSASRQQKWVLNLSTHFPFAN